MLISSNDDGPAFGFEDRGAGYCNDDFSGGSTLPYIYDEYPYTEAECEIVCTFVSDCVGYTAENKDKSGC